MKKIMNKKKVMIPIIFVLVLIVAMFSGCQVDLTTPVYTDGAYWYGYPYTHLKGGLEGYGAFKASNQSFVVDTVSHENWENYSDRYAAIIPYKSIFYIAIYWDDLPEGKYYFRALAYCYDFRNDLNFTDGWYQGAEMSFTQPWS